MDTIQRRLFVVAAVFLGLYSLVLSLSPAVLARSWQADYRWNHWIGYVVWLVGYVIVLQRSQRKLPFQDPFLLPLVGLLSGWGLLTIWRLTARFGTRQTIWLGLALVVFIVGLQLKSPLATLRRYKYLWLTGGLLLTATTLVFGTNPLGHGPRLWLGCCGIYLQPSEPLKLLLVVFLSAYLADWQSILISSGKGPGESSPTQDSGRSALPASRFRLPAFQLQILIPTLLMTGIALSLLVVQRDLGTASVFIVIYSTMIYLATGWHLIALISPLGLGLAGLAGYALFDVVRIRVEAWINPWIDPSGRSYQIVQSLIALANGGMFGRGPGLGNPNVVPIAHSDFIFSAIVEESGLVGALALLILLGLFLQRGISTALHASDSYQRYLAGGLTAFLIAQSILIIGGNLRLLPLTGVTLPFVSYGGSSLLVSYIALFLLLHISAETEESQPNTEAPARAGVTLLPITGLLLSGLAATALVNGWWSYQRGPDLLTRTDNPRRAIADQTVQRGALLDRQNTPLVITSGQPGTFTRTTLAPQLGPILGYNNPIYGQTGLEQGLDEYLRGQQGHDPLTIWWHHLLYGQPPPGLDVRLTLDMELLETADSLLNEQIGALIMLNAESGEILAMASYPTYNPNGLEDIWDQLIQDQDAPLLNRAIQGQYSIGNLEQLLSLDAVIVSWRDPVQLRLPGGEDQLDEAVISPMNMALLAASLSNEGLMPAAQIAQAYLNPQNQWTLLPSLSEAIQLIPPTEARAISTELKDANTPTWHVTFTPQGENLTWFLGGTTADWNSDKDSLALAMIIEKADRALAEQFGQAMLEAAMIP